MTTKQTYFIGVDPAWTGPQGIAVVRGREVVWWKVVEVEGFVEVVGALHDAASRERSGLDVRASLIQFFDDMILEYDADFALFVEDWQYHLNPRTYTELRAGQQRWIDAAELLGIPWYPVELQRWRKYHRLSQKWKLTSNEKQQAIDAARNLFGVELPADAAEAALIAFWGQSHWALRKELLEAVKNPPTAKERAKDPLQRAIRNQLARNKRKEGKR